MRNRSQTVLTIPSYVIVVVSTEGRRRIEHFPRAVDGDLVAMQRRMCREPGESTFQLTHVRDQLGRQEQGNLGVEPNPLQLGLAPKDGDAGLQVRRLEVGDQAPFEAAAQPLLQPGNVLGHLVGVQDDLRTLRMQGVEGVEELLLRTLAARQRVDVVDDEEVHPAQPALELLHPVPAETRDEVADEGIGGEIRNSCFRASLQDRVADGGRQMGLSEA